MNQREHQLKLKVAADKAQTSAALSELVSQLQNMGNTVESFLSSGHPQLPKETSDNLLRIRRLLGKSAGTLKV